MQEKNEANALEKKVFERLQIFKTAKKLGNVAEACRLGGITRTQFYAYKKRYKEFGLEGLRDRPPLRLASESKDEQREKVRDEVIHLALGHPDAGYVKLAKLYPDQWPDTSPNPARPPSYGTIRRILLDEGLGTQRERWLHLEASAQSGEREIWDEQIPFMARFNPAWREAESLSEAPGDHLCQMVVARRELSHGSAIVAHIGVDTFDSRAWAIVRDRRQKGDAEMLLKQQIVPFYEQHGLRMRMMQTHQDHEFSPKNQEQEFRLDPKLYQDPKFGYAVVPEWKMKLQPHPYGSYLRDRDIPHQTAKIPMGAFNGVAERFYLTFLDEFLLPRLQSEPHVAIEELQSDLDVWLKFYNEERPHLGYPNRGKPPAQRFAEFLAQKEI